jgi:hypothetical protein
MREEARGHLNEPRIRIPAGSGTPFEIADRIVLMWHGEKLADSTPAEMNQDELIELIVGFKREVA